MINVTKTFLPSFEDYTATLKRAWDNGWITNNGELVRELEQELMKYLGVNHLLFAANGTIVLQMALKALNITKEVITTPFSYVASTNAILWEGCKPVYVDINPATLCIDADKIEAAITKDTEAILATHVYGISCDIEKIQAIADKYKLKVIYDAAHAFGCTYKGKSLLSYGDISTCSFHATKVFHTVEGGAIICNNKDLFDKLYLYRSFGHLGDDYYCVGINGKNSEFHAAMGLVNLKHISNILEQRKILSYYYCQKLTSLKVTRPLLPGNLAYNYSYYPIIFETESQLLNAVRGLQSISVNPRRYFYPSLNRLPFIEDQIEMPFSDSISCRVLCLPLFNDLEKKDIDLICDQLIKTQEKGT
jgi:dTDP-4-amino-4,6-dideoxygalactose transaminase